MFSRPLMNPVTRTWFPRSRLMDEWNDMLSWQEHHAQQQRLYEQSLELQHKSHKDCNTSCASTCMEQPIHHKITHQIPYHNNCSRMCESPTPDFIATIPSHHHASVIHCDWSGTTSADKEYVITAYIPDGFTPAEVTISLDELDRLLTITCQQKYHQQQRNANGKIISTHSSSSHTQRTLHIPDDVDLHAISASKNQGEANHPAAGASLQLLIHMPKLNTTSTPTKSSVKQIHIQ